MAKIKPLPNDVVQLIAAGEVIDSLGAVVRELAENAIDAGATRIHIDINPSLWKIRVADNGHGMDLEDLELCATPHSTSKIGDRHDLAHISSLGFRGEALYSIAQVAHLSIASCTAGDTGYLLNAHQDKISTASLHPMSVGSIVTVEHLFANFPVRRNALPSLQQQLKTIQQIIFHLALCYPKLTWQVNQPKGSWFQIAAGETALDILPQLLKSLAPQDLVYRRFTHAELPLLEEHCALELVVGLPDRCHRHQPDWLKLAVNGRIVKFPLLEHSIIKAFYRTLPRDRHPVCFAHLHLPPEQIDWNRHPAKSEIYLQHQARWQDVIKEAIARTLRLSKANLPKLENQRVLDLMIAAEPKAEYTVTPKKAVQITTTNIDLKIIGQSRNTYILVEHKAGIWLVEQHIAHERVIFEQIQEKWQIIPSSSPVILGDLSAKQLEQLTENLGLTLEPFGENLWKVTTIPAALQTYPDLEAALFELADGGDLGTAQAVIACRTAVKNGTPLRQEVMADIINHWQQTKNPHTCPHGRPIYLSLEETSLYRFFRRHWVLGKSHGITETKSSKIDY
ncbi:DNA mismatch repair endonuclease MutL [[Limnothrix rosea] IAM M-220]|uniref:DNA mismatch repair endonuclease MutL n=1 Tax=[Limnothrix rosea] IAM M-220 TaxID=454133 RepID=UPI00095B54D1|nr:DNA mismatch repair endonuclease MutL [[Limnothrix rosea] IAM M-220]OKH15167.1 DNA mismatch repair protein MutL [[Limnothrix rosea] IAM M-220]